jgi:hypothetical protein
MQNTAKFCGSLADFAQKRLKYWEMQESFHLPQDSGAFDRSKLQPYNATFSDHIFRQGETACLLRFNSLQTSRKNASMGFANG